jgi:hypothetical protein
VARTSHSETHSETDVRDRSVATASPRQQADNDQAYLQEHRRLTDIGTGATGQGARSVAERVAVSAMHHAISCTIKTTITA